MIAGKIGEKYSWAYLPSCQMMSDILAGPDKSSEPVFSVKVFFEKPKRTDENVEDAQS